LNFADVSQKKQLVKNLPANNRQVFFRVKRLYKTMLTGTKLKI